MLSREFLDFYKSWILKSEGYGTSTLRECFDKFISYYIVYNRLYAEVTFNLSRDGSLNIENRNVFPDRLAACEYILQYVGAENLISTLADNSNTNESINQIIGHIENQRFYIKLDMVTGDRQPEQDYKLLSKLKSENNSIKAAAILDVIYSIRCNMFHGHKGFNDVQKGILIPSIILLRKLCEILFERLTNNT